MTKSNHQRFQLSVLRHGKASWKEPCRDFDRPLTDKGIHQVEEIAKWMIAHELKPDFIITSPAKRTLMTTNIVSKALKFEQQKIQIDSQIYEANLERLLKVLARCPSKSNHILLVGHNPSLENLVEFLLSSPITTVQAHDERLLPATLVSMTINVAWAELTPGCAELLSITHGKFLH